MIFTDPGESSEETARRELNRKCATCFHFQISGIEYDTLDMIFLARYDTVPEVEAGDDLIDSVWIAYDDIEFEKIAFRSLRQAVQRYLES